MVTSQKEKTTGEKESQAGLSLQAYRLELLEIEVGLEDLRIQFEQYFNGTVKLPPEKEHQSIQRKLRDLQKKPTKNAALSFQARAIKTRYNTLATYWQRVFRAKEAGTYAKDLYKADLRERIVQEEARGQTNVGKAEHAFKQLFNSYQQALEQTTGSAQKLDYQAFQRSILRRTSELRGAGGGQKVSFKVVIKNGKVTVQAQAK